MVASEESHSRQNFEKTALLWFLVRLSSQALGHVRGNRIARDTGRSVSVSRRQKRKVQTD